MSEKKLSFTFDNAWTKLGKSASKKALKFAEGYKEFLNDAKTERECVTVMVDVLNKKGYKDLDQVKALKEGDKVYRIIKEKGLVAAVMGKRPVTDGINLLGAHIDSPRTDLKPMPLYESDDMAFLKTHYYGGIKKYQFTTIPLSMHGIIFNERGEKKTISIGEEPGDPVFTITELLIHLAETQMQRKGSQVVKGEEMNVLFAGMPIEDEDEKKKVKAMALKLLYDKYKITEKDFISAELEMVPAFKAQDVGIDRSMVGGYGQDDRVCAYTELMALLDVKDPEITCAAYFTDKEETGSNSNTGATSRLYENVLAELLYKSKKNANDMDFRTMLANSKMLSSDVTAAFEPNYKVPDIFDKLNSTYLGKGVGIVKYSGSRGKYGCNDSSGEFFREVVNVFDKDKVPWQTGELGGVDAGGGGTIAVYMAQLGMDVIDCGVPVLSMHSPFEITSKADIYCAYLGFLAFIQKCGR